MASTTSSTCTSARARPSRPRNKNYSSCPGARTQPKSRRRCCTQGIKRWFCLVFVSVFSQSGQDSKKMLRDKNPVFKHAPSGDLDFYFHVSFSLKSFKVKSIFYQNAVRSKLSCLLDALIEIFLPISLPLV